MIQSIVSASFLDIYWACIKLSIGFACASATIVGVSLLLLFLWAVAAAMHKTLGKR